jgi:arabinonate dehydratase
MAMSQLGSEGFAIRLHPGDSVAVVRRDVLPGESVDSEVITQEPIPRGHKVALREHAVGDAVTKYGERIGRASAHIAPGFSVHTHNLGFTKVSQHYEIGTNRREFGTPSDPARFSGIIRPDGRVATRNYIGILPSVNCSATVARFVADEVRRSDLLAGYGNVDGVVALSHGSGCGMGSGLGLDLLRRALAGYAAHPNFGAVVVVGLGCEVNQIDALVDTFDLAPGTLLRTLTIQESGGTAAAVRAGVTAVRELLPEVDDVCRTSTPASGIVLGLQCGGSDAWSGVTANPALGAAVDLLIRHGGTAVLGETPEIYGAEHLLTRRAVSEAVAGRLIERIHWWEEYTAANGGSMDNNPSPGNKAGGLTTILEKSLGAVAKAGTGPLHGVVGYAEYVTTPGLVFMDTPGYDPVSVTGMIAGGANVVCFTTGRGSVFGSKPVPTIKLATNTAMYERMRDDMDINCGTILDGSATIEEMGNQIFERVLAVASGEASRSELLGFGDEEFTPWALGSVM